MAVLVLGAVLVFNGRMDMNPRCCKHSGQEGCTEYCHASSSHNLGMLFGPDLGVKGFASRKLVQKLGGRTPHSHYTWFSTNSRTGWSRPRISWALITNPRCVGTAAVTTGAEVGSGAG